MRDSSEGDSKAKFKELLEKKNETSQLAARLNHQDRNSRIGPSVGSKSKIFRRKSG